MDWLDSTVWKLAIALFIGLLIGAERERRKGKGPTRAAAGIRTFALVSLVGGVSAAMGVTALLAISGLFVGVLATISYVLSDRKDPGLTTEVALIITFLLGVLAQSDPMLSVAIGVVVAILLVSRPGIHRFVKKVLSEEELHDGLLFAGATLVILPLVPDTSIGPFEFLNPRRFWLLVVLMLGIQAASYVAVRLAGSRIGLPISGFFGGFVSSSATIASLGAKTRKHPSLFRPAVAGAVFSTVATVIQLSLILAAVSFSTLGKMLPSLLFAGIAALGYGIFFSARLVHEKKEVEQNPGRAFSFKIALIFSLVVLFVLFISSAASEWLGRSGVILTAALAGFADVHAAAISVASLVSSARLLPESSIVPILAAFTTNTLAKIVMAFWWGKSAFALRLVPGLLLVLAAAWIGALV